MFGALYLALAGLLRDRVRPFPTWLTIDGLLAGLALTALASAAFYPLRDATHGDIHTVAVALARLVGDLLLLVVVLVGFTATGGRPGRGWWLLGAGLAVTAFADAIYALLADYVARHAARQPVAARPDPLRARRLAAHRRAHPRPRRLGDGRGPADRLRALDHRRCSPPA